MSLPKTALAVVISIVPSLAPASADAQCPDGSPPPCRSRQVAAAPKRVNPPLDERTWIVVPFDNLARSQEVDWLRNASVNLLYLDMSRWRDIRVIDDERVADLIRETPEASNAASMSLNAGLAVARRAGAGRLVMGDLLRLGSRTAVTAKVFNVRTGQRVRSVREETAVQDSVMPLFGKLAQRILNVAPPQGARVGSLGTTRVDAYQEYVAGLQALNAFDLAEARRRLGQALALDSTFALAHYKMAIVIGWQDPSDAERRKHADAASRLMTGLPPRERALITGQLQQTQGEWTRACETYRGLLKADSLDVESWYGLGECLYHDNTVEAAGGDTTRMRYRADYNAAIDAFERVLELDPTYHLAYQHILDILMAERHGQGCYRAEPTGRCTFYNAMLIAMGDTIVHTPTASPRDSAKLREQAERYVQTRSRRRNLERAHAAALAWVQSNPNESRARQGLALVLMLQGNTAAADAEMARARSQGAPIEELRRILARLEIAIKLGRAQEALRIYDSVRATSTALGFATGGPGGPPTFGGIIGSYGPTFGRLAEFDSLITTQMRLGNAQPFFIEFQRHAFRAALGVPTDSFAIAEATAFQQLSAQRGVVGATKSLGPALFFAMRVPRAAWPAIDTTIPDERFRLAVAAARADTARIRRGARIMDSLSAVLAATGNADSGYAVIAADAYLLVRDSAAALTVLRRSLDTLTATTTLMPMANQGGSAAYFYPRSALLRADVAAALGHRDEARVWYKRFLDLWATADPELRPVVERARRAYAAVGGTV
jgi:tetratricopeptide (TPR) repeat protein/TolB-like protein